MTNAGFRKLTDDMQRAHDAFIAFMEPWTHEKALKRPHRSMTEDDRQQALALLQKKREIEDRWLTFMRSSELVED